MSDEALNEVAQEEDIIDLLAAQGLEQEDEAVEEIQTEMPEDIDSLNAMLAKEREKVSKRNMTIKKRTDATHRMQDEISSLTQQIADLKTQSTSTSNNEAKNEEYKESLQTWRDSVNDDPSKAVDFVTWHNDDMQDKVVNLIANMQTEFDAKIAEIEGGMNPERMQNREKIDKLRQNPQFAGFSDDQLVTLIKTTSGIKRNDSISGRPAVAKASKEKALDDARKKAKAHFNGSIT